MIIRGKGTPPGEPRPVSTCFVKGSIAAAFSKHGILDSDATIDCISPHLCDGLSLTPTPLRRPWKVILANDTIDTVTRYVTTEVVVGGILTSASAFVYGLGNVDLICLTSCCFACRRRSTGREWS